MRVYRSHQTVSLLLSLCLKVLSQFSTTTQHVSCTFPVKSTLLRHDIIFVRPCPKCFLELCPFFKFLIHVYPYRESLYLKQLPQFASPLNDCLWFAFFPVNCILITISDSSIVYVRFYWLAKYGAKRKTVLRVLKTNIVFFNCVVFS